MNDSQPADDDDDDNDEEEEEEEELSQRTQAILTIAESVTKMQRSTISPMLFKRIEGLKSLHTLYARYFLDESMSPADLQAALRAHYTAIAYIDTPQPINRPPSR